MFILGKDAVWCHQKEEINTSIKITKSIGVMIQDMGDRWGMQETLYKVI